jgi:hypothetical protein
MARGECRASGRWGTATRGTHCREGEAGHNALLNGKTGETLSSQTVSTAIQQIAEPAVVTASRVAKLCAGGSTIAPLVTEEPDERIVHVRICGGPGRVTAGPTRMPTARRAAPCAPQHIEVPLGRKGPRPSQPSVAKARWSHLKAKAKNHK